MSSITKKNYHNLYVWGNSPLNKNTYNKLKFLLKKNIENNILCFCSEKKSKEFKGSMKNIPIAITIFDEKKINTKDILNFHYFYFPRYNNYKTLKKFLDNNNIKEPRHYEIGYRKYPPVKIFLKYNNNYLKFLTINKGNEDSEDESLYTEFLDCYEYNNELFNNPYITYHPGGGILDFKTKSNKRLLTNKIDSYKLNHIKKNDIVEIFSIEISPSIFSKLEKFSLSSIKKFLKRNWINLVEIGPCGIEIIKQDDAKPTFIIFDIAIKKDLNLYFNIHKIIDNEVLEKFSNDNYISICFLNSVLGLTIFFKENNIKTKNITQDLKVIMKKSSFNLKLAYRLG